MIHRVANFATAFSDGYIIDFTPRHNDGTDWQLLAAPPPGESTEARGFASDGQWHGEEAQFFLIRFPDPQETGIFNLTPRDGGVLGPVS
jgi:hypothetical protein